MKFHKNNYWETILFSLTYTIKNKNKERWKEGAELRLLVFSRREEEKDRNRGERKKERDKMRRKEKW